MVPVNAQSWLYKFLIWAAVTSILPATDARAKQLEANLSRDSNSITYAKDLVRASLEQPTLTYGDETAASTDLVESSRQLNLSIRQRDENSAREQLANAKSYGPSPAFLSRVENLSRIVGQRAELTFSIQGADGRRYYENILYCSGSRPSSIELIRVDSKVGTTPRIINWGLVTVGTNYYYLFDVVLDSIRATDEGQFQARIYNDLGSATSESFQITVFPTAVRPSINIQPASELLESRFASTTLSVTATGPGPISYRWFKDNVEISSGIGDGFKSINPGGTGWVGEVAGTYYVYVSNSIGGVFSDNAILSFAPDPSIKEQPSGLNLVRGGTGTLVVIASGTGPFTYQWRKNGVAIEGSTSARLPIGPALSGDAGYYSVIVKNSLGSVTSSDAQITVSGPPAILQQPADMPSIAGDSISFSVEASGEGTLSYQWRKNGSDLPGQTKRNFTVSSNVSTNDEGIYSVRITQPDGLFTDSRGAFLKVRPIIDAQPQNASVVEGATVTFSISATGSTFAGPITYQWFRRSSENGTRTSIGIARAPSYTISSVSAGDAGFYEAEVYNDAGPTRSAPARLTVTSNNPQPAATPPTISTQPASTSVAAGNNASFTVTAAGSAPLSYQWRKDGTAIPSATTPTFTLSSVSASDAGAYSVVISNSAGSITSTDARLTVTSNLGSWISNVSVRATLAPQQALTVGLSTTGGSKNLLLRAVGPGLKPFGVANAMADPKLTLFDNQNPVASNDDWSNDARLKDSAFKVGAFALDAGSKDSAMLVTISGGRTAQVQSSLGGNVLLEAYDIDGGRSASLTNVSTLTYAGSGESVLIAGFVIEGEAPKQLLVRAVGPSLGNFGVSEPLADPRLLVYSSRPDGSSSLAASNDNWSPDLGATFTTVGAFPLAAASRDSAVVVTLTPGAHSVHVSPNAGAAGRSLLEVYELPRTKRTSLNDLIGRYRREPYTNGAHGGEIRLKPGSTTLLQWVNDGGWILNLEPDLGNDRLITDPSNPYYNDPYGYGLYVARNFRLEYRNGELVGFRFLYDLFERR